MGYLRIALAAAVFLLSFGGFLAAGVPAGWLVQRVNTRLAPVQASLSDAHGTAWHGSGQLVYAGTTLGHLDWTTSPWPLVHGTLSARLHLRGSSLDAHARLTGGNQGLTLSHLRGRSDLPLLARLANLPTALKGTLVANLDTVSIGPDGMLESASGRLEAHDARLSDFGVNLGTLALQLQPSGQGVNGVLQNSGGDLNLRGRLTLRKNGTYTLHATLKPHAGQNRLRDGLSAVLGSPDQQGRYHYDTRGRLTR